MDTQGLITVMAIFMSMKKGTKAESMLPKTISTPSVGLFGKSAGLDGQSWARFFFFFRTVDYFTN